MFASSSRGEHEINNSIQILRLVIVLRVDDASQRDTQCTDFIAGPHFSLTVCWRWKIIECGPSRRMHTLHSWIRRKEVFTENNSTSLRRIIPALHALRCIRISTGIYFIQIWFSHFLRVRPLQKHRPKHYRCFTSKQKHIAATENLS